MRFATIIDSKAMFYLTTLNEFLRDRHLKSAFMNMKSLPFIPEGKLGSHFDSLSCFGVFMRPSILGHNISGYVYQ